MPRHTALLADNEVAKSTHEYSGLWLQGFLQVPKENLIHLLFFIRWSAADIYYNVTCADPLPDPHHSLCGHWVEARLALRHSWQVLLILTSAQVSIKETKEEKTFIFLD